MDHDDESSVEVPYSFLISLYMMWIH